MVKEKISVQKDDEEEIEFDASAFDGLEANDLF